MIGNTPGLWSLMLKPDSFADKDGADWKKAIAQRASQENSEKTAGSTITDNKFTWFPHTNEDCTDREKDGLVQMWSSVKGSDNKCGFKFHNYFDNPMVVERRRK